MPMDDVYACVYKGKNKMAMSICVNLNTRIK
jgi:hypothetical protein